MWNILFVPKCTYSKICILSFEDSAFQKMEIDEPRAGPEACPTLGLSAAAGEPVQV